MADSLCPIQRADLPTLNFERRTISENFGVVNHPLSPMAEFKQRAGKGLESTGVFNQKY
jgi:hypothetical protein